MRNTLQKELSKRYIKRSGDGTHVTNWKSLFVFSKRSIYLSPNKAQEIYFESNVLIEDTIESNIGKEFENSNIADSQLINDQQQNIYQPSTS